MTISFNQIPVDIRVPGQYIEFDNSRAVAGLPVQKHKILVIGQKLPAGTAAANTPTLVMSSALAKGYFGIGSMLAGMFETLKAANNYTETWAIALDDNAAGVAATKMLTIVGTATESRTLNLYIAGRRVQVAVATGDTETTVAANIVVAITSNPNLPVTATQTAGDVTLTAKHKGECGNDIDVRLNFYGERTPAGLTVTIATQSAGSGNPDVSTAVAAMAGEWYNTVIMPYTDNANFAVLDAEMATRWGPLTQQEGQVFSAVAGSHAAIATWGSNKNSLHWTIMGAQNTPTPPWEIAAVVGAVDAFEPDPARPRQTLRLPGVLPPAPADRYTQSERNLHLNDGISTFVVDQGGNTLIERLITTYQTNAFGLPDISYLDICTPRTLAFLRFSVRARISQKYGRHKLAADGTNYAPGQAIVTPRMIRAELVALFTEWEKAGLAEDIEQFKTDLLVQRSDTDPNRIDAVIPPNVVNQFRVFAAAVQFRI
jgi:phage tail sheath gpL-like